MKQDQEHKFQIGALIGCLIFSMCANVYAFLIVPKIVESQRNEIVVTKLDPAYFEEDRISKYTLPEETPAVEIVLAPKQEKTVEKKSEKEALPSLQYAGAAVYVTKSGKKFHRESCSSLSKSKIPMLYEEACSDGYTPCGKCKP